MPTTTRDRIVDASAELFRRNGYTGTGLKQILAQAEAPFGSLYHFFPGGKGQLGEEVIRTSGAYYLQLVATVVLAAPDIVTGIGDAFAGAAERLRATGYADACPIATIALEVASTSEPLRQATADVFESWIAALAAAFAATGIARVRARELAIEAITGLEGAFILSRAIRTTMPVEVAGRAIVASVREALADVAPKTKKPRSAR
jgi:AcrR family transcriptional regulator